MLLRERLTTSSEILLNMSAGIINKFCPLASNTSSEEPVEPGCPIAIFVDAVRNRPGIVPAGPDRAELLSLARSARLTGAMI